MKQLITLLAMLLCVTTVQAAANDLYKIVPGHDYYIVNRYYKRPLALSEDLSQPRLVAYNEQKDEQYIFTAEEAPNKGYVLLKHKASGRYICASTSNGYSIVTQTTKGTGDSYQWRIRPGRYGFLVSKKNTSATMGVDIDEESKEYIGVWYDKEQGAPSSEFEVFEANGSKLKGSKLAWARTLLSAAIEDATAEKALDGLNTTMVNKMDRTLQSATVLLNTAEEADTMLSKSEIVRDTMAYMNSAQANVMLTLTDLESYGSVFSLGLSEVQMNTAYANDSAIMVIRNKEGLGAHFGIKENGSYAFVMNDAVLNIFKDQQLIKTIDAYYVPTWTKQGNEPEWTILRKNRLSNSLPELLSESSEVTKGGEVTVNKYGIRTRNVIALNNVTMDLDEELDFHIIAESKAMTNCSINLKSNNSWIVFDNIKPSEVISSYLSQIKINGRAASTTSNCRVAIYLNGAAVIPFKTTEKVFEAFTGEQYSGETLSYGVGFHKNLGKNSNKIRSFRLRRGFMATVASDTDGGGYSRVYVADHKDIEIPVLPSALYGRISSITIKKWQYVSKKGWCSTQGTSAITSQMKKINATWFYTWGADRSSTDDYEYVPIRQHIYWPSISDIASKDATACLSFNEPDHSEQHNDCACGGTISEWTSCTKTPDFQQTGMRIGSPAPTTDSWLTTYINHCNDMAYRCDFVALHSYWGSNECNDGNAWYSRLKAIYDATKRPIWITEWAYGASWTKESWPSGWSDKLEQNRWRVKDILKKLEEAPFVERYAYYQWDTQFRNLVDWNDGHVTPAGRVYRDMKSNFAYNANYQFTPVWWEPGKKTPVITSATVNDVTDMVDIVIANGNKDVTDILTLQYLDPATEQWTNYYTEEDRSKFDKDTLKYSFPVSDFDVENTLLRVYMKRLINKGDEAYSQTVFINSSRQKDMTSSIKNPSANDGTKSWTCSNVEQKTGEASDGNSSNPYFNMWKNSAYTSTMSQTLTDLPEGLYTLSALLRSGATSKVEITAERKAPTADEDMSVTATITGTGNESSAEDTYKNGWKKATCEAIELRAGDKLIISLKATCPAGGWWSADDFTLIWHTTDNTPDAIETIQIPLKSGVQYDMTGRIANSAKGVIIEQGKKILK